MIEYAVERFPDIEAELPPLFKSHWERIALDRASIELNPSWEAYREYDAIGALSCITVREHRKLIGYYFFIKQRHLHYHQSWTAFTDIYYIKPSVNLFTLYGRYKRLFQAAESEMRRLGVQKAYTEVKLHSDFLGKLFMRLGWRPAATSYVKLLEP